MEKQVYVNELNEKVLEMCPDDIEQEVDEAAEGNFRIDEIIAKNQTYEDNRFAQPIASGHRGGPPRDNSSPARNSQNEESANNSHELNSSGISIGSAAIRLQKLMLPRFNGDVASFTSHAGRFQLICLILIHMNNS